MVLFWEMTETLGGRAYPEEVGHWEHDLERQTLFLASSCPFLSAPWPLWHLQLCCSGPYTMMLCLVTGPGPKQLVLIRTTHMCHYFQLEWNLKYQYCATLDLARPPEAPGLTACFLFPLCSQWDEVGSSERLSNYWGYPAKGDRTILLSSLVSGPPQGKQLAVWFPP